MHEFSMVRQVVESLKKSAEENGIAEVKNVKFVVGVRHSCLGPSLRYCFQLLAERPPFSKTYLEIEEKALRFTCSCCKTEFETSEVSSTCPVCASADLKILSGDEFYVDYYEGE